MCDRACVYAYVRVCMRTCVCACVNVYACVYVCTCVCVGVRAYVCVCVRAEGGKENYVSTDLAAFCGNVVFAECLPRVHYLESICPSRSTMLEDCTSHAD